MLTTIKNDKTKYQTDILNIEYKINTLKNDIKKKMRVKEKEKEESEKKRKEESEKNKKIEEIKKQELDKKKLELEKKRILEEEKREAKIAQEQKNIKNMANYIIKNYNKKKTIYDSKRGSSKDVLLVYTELKKYNSTDRQKIYNEIQIQNPYFFKQNNINIDTISTMLLSKTEI